MGEMMANKNCLDCAYIDITEIEEFGDGSVGIEAYCPSKDGMMTDLNVCSIFKNVDLKGVENE